MIYRLPWPLPGARIGDVAALASAAEPVVAEDPSRIALWSGRFDVLAVEGGAFVEVRSDAHVAASDETVAVPAGTFARCVAVETIVAARPPGAADVPPVVHRYREWYARGVGLVKMETAVEVDGRMIDVLTAELAAYESPTER